jgi:hypothetical protein
MMTWTIDGSLALQNLDIIDGNGRICLIDCYDDHRSDEELMANTRLIAAAPDLLQALHDVDAYLAPEGDEEDVYNYVRAIIKLAISKTQGA